MGIIENIHAILAAVVLVLVDLAAVYKAVKVIVAKAQAVKDSTAQEREDAKQAILDSLPQIIFGMVTDAEKEFGGGTGKLKSAKVASWVYDKIPDDIKPLVGAEEIQDLIDEVLKDAQEYWSKNKCAKEYIESGAAVTIVQAAPASAPDSPVDGGEALAM